MRCFRKINNKRYVLARVDNIYVYHPECCPMDRLSYVKWVRTEKTNCHGCGNPLRSDPTKTKGVKNESL